MDSLPTQQDFDQRVAMVAINLLLFINIIYVTSYNLNNKRLQVNSELFWLKCVTDVAILYLLLTIIAC